MLRARFIFGLLALSGFAGWAHAQTDFDAGYRALVQKDYDAAITAFRKGLEQQPDDGRVHKDLAYTLLKAGENADARDEFKLALTADSSDESAALEFAFLAFETKQPIEARRMFDKLRKSGAAQTTRQTAEQAFQNIDQPLVSGIARWKQALARTANPDDPSTFSAHWELAQLAELRDELPLAAQQYEICRKLRPQMGELLLALGRVWKQLNRADDAQAAVLAASRSQDSRTAEFGLEQLGSRYPYPYEFVNALKIDPQNTALRRELAYLYLAMHKPAQAEEQFNALIEISPDDQAARNQLNALHGFKSREPEVTPVVMASIARMVDPKALGLKSLKLGYLNDAVKYLLQAHERDPGDAEVTLQLGWAYNAAKNDTEAIRWFDLARHAPDADIAAQASTAFHNLNGDTLPQTTVWELPMYSSRWNDLFSYGQVKRSIPLPWKTANRFFSLYASTRFMGDVRSSLPVHTASPQDLSESSFIPGLGISSKTWHHVTAWAEAGEAVKYLPGRRDWMIPDYRGGLNFAKGFGSLLGSKTSGFYYETSADAVYVNRFNKDWLFYSQNRSGRTFHAWGNAAQMLFNFNYTHDLKNQYWADTVEIGPGVKFRASWMPRNLYLSADFLHGIYTGYSPRPNYNDVRVSLWYAATTKQ